MPLTSRTALIAIGGNSLIRAGQQGTAGEQMDNARRTAAAIVGLVRDGYRLVITHGNGPQVGAALLRSDLAREQVHSQPLDVCDAGTQGEIGYMLQQALTNELSLAGLRVRVVTVLTQVVVSAADAAMQHPTKPIGRFYTRQEAYRCEQMLGWRMVEDAGRGWRRVVPSPEPVEIVEFDVIRRLVEDGVLVIAAGGGGIPVVRAKGALTGIEAVIDKDRASALLAARLGVDVFAISTDSEFVYLDYRRPTQHALTCVTAAEIERHYKQGQFPPGNMGPKIESALRFLRDGGKEVVITSYEHLYDAMTAGAGTHILTRRAAHGHSTVRALRAVAGCRK
jgi:carbamate kinase